MKVASIFLIFAIGWAGGVVFDRFEMQRSERDSIFAQKPLCVTIESDSDIGIYRNEKNKPGEMILDPIWVCKGKKP